MTWWAVPAPRFELGAHVIPLDDDREHIVSRHCWCGPQLDPDCPEFVWMHPSADGREAHEGMYGKPTH